MNILVMYSTHAPTPHHLDRLRSIVPDGRVRVARDEPDAIAYARDTQVILGHRYLRQSLPAAAGLRWVQTTAGGVDRLPLAELSAMGVTLTRCVVTSPAIARHAVTLAWAVSRRLTDAADRQARGVWDNNFDWPRAPHRAIVFGLGTVGRSIAERLHREGIEVVGVCRGNIAGPVPGVGAVVTDETWREVLPEMDWCFLALPHTPETAGLFDEPTLQALPAHATLVNVGRGETVVNDGLARVLRSGHLAGAALDVVAPQPVGPDDPLWSTPRLLITPHVAAHYAERAAETEAFIERQLARYAAGLPLDRVIPLRAKAA